MQPRLPRAAVSRNRLLFARLPHFAPQGSLTPLLLLLALWLPWLLHWVARLTRLTRLLPIQQQLSQAVCNMQEKTHIEARILQEVGRKRPAGQRSAGGLW